MQGRHAGLVSRLVADSIDAVVIVVAVSLAYLGASGVRFLVAPRRFTWSSPSIPLLVGVGWVILVVYLTLAWNGSGRTIGKQLMGLRVERLDGTRMGIGIAFVRAIACCLVPIGIFWSPFNHRAASLQDLIVRSKVVYDWRPRVGVPS